MVCYPPKYHCLGFDGTVIIYVPMNTHGPEQLVKHSRKTLLYYTGRRRREAGKCHSAEGWGTLGAVRLGMLQLCHRDLKYNCNKKCFVHEK